MKRRPLLLSLVGLPVGLLAILYFSNAPKPDESIVEPFRIGSVKEVAINVMLEYPGPDGRRETVVGTSLGAFHLGPELEEISVSAEVRQETTYLNPPVIRDIALFENELWFATEQGLMVKRDGELQFAMLGLYSGMLGAHRAKADLNELTVGCGLLFVGGTNAVIALHGWAIQEVFSVEGAVDEVQCYKKGDGSLDRTLAVATAEPSSSLHLFSFSAGRHRPIVSGSHREIYRRVEDVVGIYSAGDRIWFKAADGLGALRLFYYLWESGGLEEYRAPKGSDITAADLLRGNQLFVGLRTRVKNEPGESGSRVEHSVHRSVLDEWTGRWSALERLNIPIDEQRLGPPSRFLVDHLRNDGLWIRTTMGLVRGQVGIASSFRPPMARLGGEHGPTRIGPTKFPFVSAASKEGILSLQQARKLVRVHPETRLALSPQFSESFLFWKGAVIQELPLFETGLLIGSQGKLNGGKCLYRGPTAPVRSLEPDGCPKLFSVLTTTEEERDARMAAWPKAQTNTALDSRDPEPPLQLDRPMQSVYAGVRDRYGNERSFRYFYIDPKWAMASAIALFVLVARFFYSLDVIFEKTFGARLSLGLHLALFRKSYPVTALKVLNKKSRNGEAAEVDVSKVAKSLQEKRLCLVLARTEEQNAVLACLESSFLKRLRDGRTLKLALREVLDTRLVGRRKPEQIGLSQLFPTRIDLDISGANLSEVVVQRLKSHGAIEKKRAVSIWEKAGFLPIIGSVFQSSQDSANEKLVDFVHLQAQDFNARFIVVTTEAAANALEAELSPIVGPIARMQWPLEEELPGNAEAQGQQPAEESA